MDVAIANEEVEVHNVTDRDRRSQPDLVVSPRAAVAGEIPEELLAEDPDKVPDDDVLGIGGGGIVSDDDGAVDVDDQQQLVPPPVVGGPGPSHNGEAVHQGAAPHVETAVYKKRWYILAVFSFLGVCQGMVWNSFGPISASVLAVFCPHWTSATLALLGNWGNIMYIIPVIPVLWYFETKGLRASMVLTAGLMALGTLLRCLPFKLAAFTWMCHICAILNGIAGIVVFSAPSAVSAAWFPPSERTTATGVALVLNNLGNAVSFLGAPAIVPDPPDNSNGTAPNHDPAGWDLIGDWAEGDVFDGGFASKNASNNSCPEIDPDLKHHIEERLDKLMYTEFGMIAVCFLAILIYFPSKPKKPPSITSSQERMAFVPALKKICRNRDALLMTLAFSLFNGLIASWYSVMNITFNPLPIGPAEDKDKVIGYIGLIAIAANSVGAIAVSRFVDFLKGKMKVTLAVLMVAAIACWIWMCLLCLRVIPFSLLQLYASTIFASMLTYSTGPIFFEFTVELVYPVPEGVVGGFLTCVYNTIGMVFLFLFYVPAIASNPDWIPYAIMSSTCLSFPLLLLVKERYNRSVIDNFQDPDSSWSVSDSSYPPIGA